MWSSSLLVPLFQAYAELYIFLEKIPDKHSTLVIGIGSELLLKMMNKLFPCSATPNSAVVLTLQGVQAVQLGFDVFLFLKFID